MKTKLLTILCVGLVASCANKKSTNSVESKTELPYYQEATFTPKWIAEDSPELEKFHKIPSFSLINQLGEIVTEKSLEGKIYVTDFFFTSCPGICPKMTTNMKLVQEAFLEDDNVMLLSHSVTPVMDSVSVLKSYADRNDIDAKKWQLLTGDRQVIYDLGRKSYFVEEDQGLEKTEDEFLHTENFVLIDQNRHIRGIYNGLNKVSVAQLIADIKTLKESLATEKSEQPF
ncbi:SCO family protein [Roseivirga misakiensis]|uniref:Electron transporter n=1 Tax=Roseivirga misakiensis TaxID=1563681 RepID=A0A1E5SL02_9BACT|nr:SCO family protein [Roseivirga misakiensis]OEJ99805.1 electron transporter [Roseivirga misakiensis]